MNIRITDKGGLKPTFTQWDVDRVLLISGCESQPSLRFDNPELSRSIVVVAEADGMDWKCNVPNFMLQFSGPMIVSVFIQPDEGKTVFTARYAVQWAKKPQDYTYEENIGYTNWVQKTEEAQELLDDIEDLRDEIQTAVDTATSASEAAVAAAEDIDETVAAALQAAKDNGAFDGADGISPIATITEISGGHEVTIVDAYGTKFFDVMDGEKGDDGVSPEVSIASITGGHAVTITDEDHPTGQTFNVMDGQDAVVDATLSNAGEAADAAETGKVKAAADQHEAELLALAPELGSDTFTWTLGKYINDAGLTRNGDGMARAAKKSVEAGALIQSKSPDSVTINGETKTPGFWVHEYNGTTWIKRTKLAKDEYVVLGSTTDGINICWGFSSAQNVTITQQMIDDNFGVRIVQKPTGGSGGTSDYNDLTNKPQINDVTLSGNKSLSDLGIAAANAIPAAATANPSDLGTAAAGSSTKYAREDHVHNAPSADEIEWTGDPLGGQTAPQDVESAVERVYNAIPSTASDIGAVAVAQGVSHAGEFVVVGSDGNITTVTMTAWSGGSY